MNPRVDPKARAAALFLLWTSPLFAPAQAGAAAAEGLPSIAAEAGSPESGSDPGRRIFDNGRDLALDGSAVVQAGGLTQGLHVAPSTLEGIVPGPERAAEAAVPGPEAAPSGKELPPTYEEWKRVEKSGFQAFLDKLLKYARIPVELFKAVFSEIMTGWAGSWEDISERLEARVADSLKGADDLSFENPEFVRRFESALATKFLPGNKATPLIDGPSSFEKRFELIDKAKKSIHILTWAVYDDETAYLTVRKLLKKAKEGVEVRVIVDGQVSHKVGHGRRMLPYLEENGIPVVRWYGPEWWRFFHGNHRKIMIVDSEAAIAGGMNIADDYSHIGVSEKWRDTDVLVEGPAALESDRLFVRVWNEQVAAGHAPGQEPLPEPQARPQDYGGAADRAISRGSVTEPYGEEMPLPISVGERPASEGRWGAAVAVIPHTPGSETQDGFLSILLAVEAARKSIDIENCYFIMEPALLRALQRAKDRGVKVRILTNSFKSIDEPVVIDPILDSAEEAREQGLEVYLWKGTLLHSKFMIVDDSYAWVGSYNIMPRSYLIEDEVQYGVLDPGFAAELRRAFEADIARAEKVTKSIGSSGSIAAFIAQFLFYNQL